MNEQVLLNKILNIIEKNLGLQAQLKDIPINNLRDQGYDAILEIQVRNQIALFKIAIKNIDRFNIVENIKKQNNSDTPMLIATPYVSREIAEKCRSIGIQFVDTAGNAYINADGIYIYVSGQPRPRETRHASRFKTISFANIKVVFALLTQRNLIQGTYRDVMNAAGVSLGSIQNVFGDLVHRGLISEKNNNERRLISPHRLIDEWVSQYLQVRSNLVLQRFSSRNPEWWKQAHLLPEYAVWGGEVAAAKLTGSLKPEKVTIYVSGKPDDIIVNNQLNSDEHGNIEILRMFWKPSKENASNLRDITHPLLIYADLLSSMDSRNKEIAKDIYDRYLQNLYY